MDDAAAKAKLLAAGDSGVSVHTHLCALIEKLLDSPDPTTALASLENLSLQVKKERAALTPAATVNVRRAPPRRTGRARPPENCGGAAENCAHRIARRPTTSPSPLPT